MVRKSGDTRTNMPFTQAGNINIYHERDGKGERLLFISGTGGDLRAKPGIFEGPLAKSFDLLAYDQRGLGQSDKPQGPYTMEQYADDAAWLMDSMEWDDAHVIGVSFGGMVAQHLVLRHPEKVTKLVLACTSSGGKGGSSFPFHTLDTLEGEAYFRKIMPLSDKRLTEAWQEENPGEFQQMIDGAMALRAHIPEDPEREGGARLQLEARQHHDTYDRLNEISCPTYICGGKYDGICEPSNLEALHEKIVDSKIRFFEGGHLFMLQDKQAVPSMIDFLIKGIA